MDSKNISGHIHKIKGLRTRIKNNITKEKYIKAIEIAKSAKDKKISNYLTESFIKKGLFEEAIEVASLGIYQRTTNYFIWTLLKKNSIEKALHIISTIRKRSFYPKEREYIIHLCVHQNCLDEILKMNYEQIKKIDFSKKEIEQIIERCSINKHYKKINQALQLDCYYKDFNSI
ncbi:MAG: hypothetical protein AAB614_03485 [Patescibacteria group bacterium]